MSRPAVLALTVAAVALLAGVVEVITIAARHVGTVPVAALLLGVPFTILGAMYGSCRSSTPVVARVRVHANRPDLH